MKTGRVLGVVSRGYRLVSNREALAWARQCCTKAFPETKASEWIVDASDAPCSGGHCFIDLRHNSTILDFSLVHPDDRPDVFGPFIRVTNSYNGLRALTFDIGFFRKVCKNGLISPRSIIRFQFTHSRRDIPAEIYFEIDQNKLSAWKNDFNQYIGGLRQCSVPFESFQPLLQGVLCIDQPKNIQRDSLLAAAWENLSFHVRNLCKKYAEEIGENAYAVFNAITDFASHPPANRCVHRERHSFQKLAGEWLSEFHGICSNKDFKLDHYLVKLARKSEELN